MIGEYLMSDQDTENTALHKLTEVKRILESLTFENEDATSQNERIRDTALMLVEAAWRVIYYANGS